MYKPIAVAFAAGLGFAGTNPVTAVNKPVKNPKPNIILILTDDAGSGDFGFKGNSMVKTPNLDHLASRSTRFTNFYVSPVCAPTRSSILTGNYAETTGIYDTYNGGAIMATEEITIAEILHKNAYQTGIFGKWHLGDNYPYRPIDQGFSESFVFKGGGLGQPGDYDNYFAGDSAYFNPVMYRNEKKVSTKGYCSDIFTNEAIGFVRNNKKKPFFAFLAFNAPHTPLQVPEQYSSIYKDLTLGSFKNNMNKMNPVMTNKELEDAKKVYGMMSNIDENIGRLIKELENLDLMKNTAIIFLSDNGPQQNRYVMGLRGRKGMVYQGGIKSPCIIHYPGIFPENKEISTTVAHIDLLPTILDFCNIKKGDNPPIDGRSMMPLLTNNDKDFNKRTLFFEWGRGFPIPFQNFAATNGHFKLVGHTYTLTGLDGFELFDLTTDPEESENVINKNKAVALTLKKEMEAWYYQTARHPNNRNVHPAIVGTKHENPVILNRNDAKGSPGIWTEEETFGYWDIRVAESGTYTVKTRFIKEIKEPGTLYLKLYPFQYATTSTQKMDTISIKNIYLDANDYRLEIYFQTKSGQCIFPLYTSVERIDKFSN